MTANKHHIRSVSLQSIAHHLTLDMAKEKIYWRVSNGNLFSCDYYSHNVIDFGTSGGPMAVFGDYIYIMTSVGRSVVSVHNTTDQRTRRKFFLPVNNASLDLAVAIHSITPDSNATSTFHFPLCGPYTYYRKINGTLNCTCMEGYSGECNSCQDINECQSSPCRKDQSCINFSGSYACRCSTGYKLDKSKKKCIDINECQSSPCHSFCFCCNAPGSFHCIRRGWGNCWLSRESFGWRGDCLR
ncbi:pro-epidermal growth factor-like [Xenia sp. Carnegie-2017]|uniref:pro-epidermal growth factor-like n=1 Tax=Xenia sp. Carnegie-2017 TaxID=2897299 RepID=UPI001F0371A4|nr:pro-epidermal growth factor-like [Xenia sp. Carnegie-2017]